MLHFFMFVDAELTQPHLRGRRTSKQTNKKVSYLWRDQQYKNDIAEAEQIWRNHGFFSKTVETDQTKNDNKCHPY